MKSASLPELLRWVAVDQEHDAQSSRVFLYSYRNFTTPSALWSALMRLSRSLSAANKSPIFNFLNLWLFCCYETDFAHHRRLRTRVLDYISNNFSLREANYLKLLALRCSARAARTSSSSLNVVLFQARPPTSTGNAITFSILNAWKTDTLAQSMLALSADITRSVRITEFTRQAWQSKFRATLAPSVTALSEYFNRISFWAVTEILREDDVALQTKRLKKTIKVMHRCIELNDLHTAAALCAGLNLTSIQRLKRPWAALAPATRHLYDDADVLLSPQKNWSRYRTHMKDSLRRGDAVVPYAAPLLKDLTFIADGNSDRVAGAPEDAINWEKMEMFGKSIELFCFAQAGLAQLSRTTALSEVTTALQWVQPLSEEGLEALSFRHEAPRNTGLQLSAATIDEVLLRDPLTWTIAEVGLFVSHHTNPFCGENFMVANIAGAQLAALDTAAMYELGVHKLGQRKLLVKHLQAVGSRPKDAHRHRHKRHTSAPRDAAASAAAEERSASPEPLLHSSSSSECDAAERTGSHISTGSRVSLGARLSPSTSASGSPLTASNSGSLQLGASLSSSRSGSRIRRSGAGKALAAMKVDPADPATWDCAAVQRWLADAGEADLVTQLEEVNGLELINLDDPTLEMLGVPTIGQRKRLAKKIRDLASQRPEGVAVQSA